MPGEGWKKLSAGDLALAEKWFAEGLSPAACAQRLGRNKSTLTRRLVKQQRIQTQGAPKKLTEAQIDYLAGKLDEMIRHAKGEYHVTVLMLKRRTRCRASARTILRAFHKRKIYFRHMREKPLLTQQDVAERYAFADKYRGKTAAWWNRSIHAFIDGKCCQVYLTQASRGVAARHATWGGVPLAGARPRRRICQTEEGVQEEEHRSEERAHSRRRWQRDGRHVARSAAGAVERAGCSGHVRRRIAARS